MNPNRIRLLAFALLVSVAAGGLAGASALADTNNTATTAKLAQETPSLSGALDVTLTVRADHTAEKIETRRIKVLGHAAVQTAGQQNVRYIEGMQSLDIVEAYTEKADGRKIPVERETLIKRDAATGLGAVYLRDLKVVSVIFPDVAIGDTIVLTTRLEHKSGVYAGHFYDQLLFLRNIPYADSMVRVIAPKDLSLKVAVYGEGLELATTSDATETRHVIRYRGQPTAANETGATSALDRDPRILISTFKDYEDQARSYWRAASANVQVTPEIAKLADEITQGIDDRRDQAEAIASWVKRNIRYVAVYLGAARVVPNKAASVLKHRYGDCKDKVTLMSALLAAKGIAYEHVLISASSAYTLPEPPTMAYVNHVMIYLPEFDVYDDPTSSFAAFGVLAEGTYDKPVMRVSANGATMARTPTMKTKDHVSIRRTRATIAADGTVSGETDQITTGVFAAGLRRFAVSIQDNGLERSAEQRLRNYGTPGKGRFEIGSLSDLGPTYAVKARFALDRPIKIVPGTMHAIPIGLAIQVRPGGYLLGARYENRTLPFVCLAGRQIEEIEVTFADGLPLPNPINGRKVETKAFVYRSSYKLEDRTLKVRREFASRVPGQVCAPETEAAIAAGMKAVKGSLATRMAFKAEAKKRPASAAESTVPNQAKPERAGLTPAIPDDARLN